MRRILLPSVLLAFSFAFVACGSEPGIEKPSGGGDGDGDGDGDGTGGARGDIAIGTGGNGGSGPGTECDDDPDLCEEPVVVPEPACGDGRINVSGEECDDGNGVSGDGCTATCTAEAEWVCPTPGKPCLYTVECGDGKVTGSETCDDGNERALDGCSDECRVEDGWACPTAGLSCRAAECGDAILAGVEECDFGGDVAGCVGCRIEAEYDCDEEGCFLTECGNGQLERGESCEDENDRPFDGCYQCRKEPECADGDCMAVCGDGQRYDTEGCDDGNARDGDGCSSQCEIEEGYGCDDVLGEPPEQLLLPVIYRDFIGERQSLIDEDTCYNARAGEAPTEQKTIPCFHPNFDGLSGTNLQNVVEIELGPDGTPDLACETEECTENPGLATNNFTTNDDFDDWYEDGHPQNISIFRELTLSRQTGSTYAFQPQGGFYPIDDAGWVVSGEEWLRPASGGGCGSGDHNYSFSTETRFIFEYQGGERFDFNGDDDLWVFVNGRLAIDLAGLHGPRAGYFQLDGDEDGDGDADSADGTATIDNPLIDETTIDLRLKVGGIYEVALFHAERNYCGSNFELTLKDFNKPQSTCASECGDGVVASDELCDDGAENNDGSYGHCGEDCRSLGPHCGDGQTDEDHDEACDDGVNLSTYGDGCAPGCVEPPHCGDGLVQSDFEDCDDGKNNGGYGECAKGCVLGPRCGDGKVQEDEGESCDDGNRQNGDECNVSCLLEGVIR